MHTRLSGWLTCGLLLGAASLANAQQFAFRPGGAGLGNVNVGDGSSFVGLDYGYNERSQIYSIWGLYSEGYIPIPPYFALHPPVYYSAPIPRTYGYSPFAYPPGVMTPELEFGEVIESPIIPNPHVAPPEGLSVPTGAQTASHAATTPLRILNPFVSEAQEILARRPSAAAEVVPAGLPGEE